MANQPSNISETIRKQIRRRFTVVIVLFAVPVAAILWRVADIQFVEGKAWRELARKQRRENVEVPPNRGNIYSRDGQLMASTVPSYALYMDFQAVKSDTLLHYINPLSNKLSQMLGDKSPSEYRTHLMKGYRKQSREYLISKKRVSHTTLRTIKQFPLFNKGRYQSGLYEKKYFQREKPFGSLASRTIGDIYGEFSKGGKNGLELQYDTLLKGHSGLSVRQKVAGKYISVITKEPEDGFDLVSTIDVYKQDIVESALAKELARINATSGTVVLMEVATGEVLAISNLAQTDSGVYNETKNFAVSDLSEPGSTFKTFSMIVALEDGFVRPDDKVETGNGRMPMYGRTMTDHNWDKGGYHTISASQSIQNSSNIGISVLIDKYYKDNPAKFVEGLYSLGLDNSFQVEIPGAGHPIIPHPKDKRYWAKTDLPWMSIGYVTQVPPIYILAIYNAIANDGKLMKPYFVRSISKNGASVKTFAPTVVKDAICSKKTLKEIRIMLDSVIIQGTGKQINSPVVNIAGKTGTAQISKGTSGYQAGGKSHQVSFCGYFPADNPRYSAIVVIREPRSELPSGGKQAGGVFREIAERICAREWRLKPGEQADSLLNQLPPHIKHGNAKAIKRAVSLLDVKDVRTNVGKNRWARISTHGDKAELSPMDVSARLVPDVRGMGARDAAYLLGTKGLYVTMQGSGKVVSQSISPGSYYNKGQTISLLLQ